MTDNIIDISHWSGTMDFTTVANAGIVAIIAKATQGTGNVDPTYTTNKQAAAPLGFLWGSYHFGSSGDVPTQVDHYLSVANPAAHELICLDFEDDGSGSPMTLAQARQFVTLIKQRTGRLPVLYGGAYLKSQLNDNVDVVLGQCPLWLAQYGTQVSLPPGWGAYELWQFTDSGNSIPGVAKTDQDRFNGTDAQLRALWPFTWKS